MAKEETQIQTEITQFLEAKGFIVTRFNNGAHKVKGGMWGKRSKSTIGVSDLLCCSPEGLFCAIEVKKPGGKPSAEQIKFVEEVKKRGGFAIIANNLGDVVQALTVT